MDFEGLVNPLACIDIGRSDMTHAQVDELKSFFLKHKGSLLSFKFCDIPESLREGIEPPMGDPYLRFREGSLLIKENDLLEYDVGVVEVVETRFMG